MTTAYLNAVGCAAPDYDIHPVFVAWAAARLSDPREKKLFLRMAERSGIARRGSVIPAAPSGGSPVETGGFYEGVLLPSTAARMALYAEHAPRLALQAIDRLAAQLGNASDCHCERSEAIQASARGPGSPRRRAPRGDEPETGGTLRDITHLVVASCTGFTAPGIDQIIAAALGLAGDVERTLIGFMGCYAAVAALRTAHHIVRSEPAARVLVVAVELSTLHMQADDAVEPLLAQLQFADGAAAALVSAEASGFALTRFFSANLPGSTELIQWSIGDQGFIMQLSGEVPARIGQALADPVIRGAMLGEDAPGAIDAWAVHAGGRSILDAVEHGFGLAPDVLAASRAVLAEHGNMSSATLMFVLARLLAEPERSSGLALAFGPGLAAEGFRFRRA